MVIISVYKYIFPESTWFYIHTSNTMYGMTEHAGIKTFIRGVIPEWALKQSSESNMLELLVIAGVTESDIQVAEDNLKKDGDRIIIDNGKLVRMWNCETDELIDL
jgi:hypothetical protein